MDKVQAVPWWLSLVVALLTAAGALIAALVVQRITLANQVRLSKLQNRQRAYSAIHGSRILVGQLLVSRTEALIHSDYHEALWRISGDGVESHEFKEAHRWMVRSESLDIDIAKAKQALFEAVGLAQANFPPTKRLSELAEKIYRFRRPQISPVPMGNDLEAVHQWKDSTKEAIHEWVETVYGQPILALADELVQHMED